MPALEEFIVSMQIVVFLNQIPSAKIWSAAIKRAQFPFALNDSFDTTRQSGFVPSSYGETPSGFEYYCDPVEDYLDEVGDDFSETDITKLQRYAYAVNFVTHSRFHDGMVAAIAAGVLTEIAGGLLLDCQTGKFVQPSEAVAWARQQEQRYLPHLSEDRTTQ